VGVADPHDDEALRPDAPGRGLVPVVKPTLSLSIASPTIDLGLADLIGRVIGRPLDQISGILADLIGVVRFELSLRLWERAKRKLEAAGLSAAPTEPVSLARLLPILESGAIEPDGSMQDRWASLLANAIADVKSVVPAFAEILRQLTPLDAHLLDALHDAAVGDDPSLHLAYGGQQRVAESATWRSRVVDLSAVGGRQGLTRVEMELAVDNVLRLRLCSEPLGMIYRGPDVELPGVVLTALGRAFVRACRDPGAG
jgi:hypothetical protein